MMKVGNHKKRQDLERLNAAAQASLGSNTPLTIIAPIHQKGSEPAKAATSKNQVKVTPNAGVSASAGVGASAGATRVVQRTAPAAKQGKEVERV